MLQFFIICIIYEHVRVMQNYLSWNVHSYSIETSVDCERVKLISTFNVIKIVLKQS